MTRYDIGNTLASLRERSELPLKGLCAALGCLPSGIYRIEKGEFNFSVEKVINYSRELKAKFMIYQKSKKTEIKNNSDCAKYIKSLRKENTLRKVAEDIEVSHTCILHAEAEKSLISIDLLLKLATYYGFEVRVEPK